MDDSDMPVYNAVFPCFNMSWGAPDTTNVSLLELMLSDRTSSFLMHEKFGINFAAMYIHAQLHCGVYSCTSSLRCVLMYTSDDNVARSRHSRASLRLSGTEFPRWRVE
eukprot:264178-Pyramimonas_sp.AAC.1